MQFAVYAFTGKPETIVFTFDKSKLNNVIDHFGTGIYLSEENESCIGNYVILNYKVKNMINNTIKFFNEFKSRITEEKYLETYKNNSKFTDVVIDEINEIIEEMGYKSQNEYFCIDLTGWISNYEKKLLKLYDCIPNIIKNQLDF